MSTRAFLDELQSKGVLLRLVGDRLRAEAPPGVLTPELRAQLSAFKSDITSALSADIRGDLTGGVVEEVRIRAVRLASPTYGCVWLAAGADDADRLEQEMVGSEDPTPVFTFDEAIRLRGKSARSLRAIIRAKAALPGSRVIQ